VKGVPIHGGIPNEIYVVNRKKRWKKSSIGSKSTLKPGDLIRRSTSTNSRLSIFCDNLTQDHEWLALILRINPPSHEYHYHIIEALVHPQNTVMKTYLMPHEMETLIEVLK